MLRPDPIRIPGLSTTRRVSLESRTRGLLLGRDTSCIPSPASACFPRRHRVLTALSVHHTCRDGDVIYNMPVPYNEPLSSIWTSLDLDSAAVQDVCKMRSGRRESAVLGQTMTLAVYLGSWVVWRRGLLLVRCRANG